MSRLAPMRRLRRPRQKQHACRNLTALWGPYDIDQRFLWAASEGRKEVLQELLQVPNINAFVLVRDLVSGSQHHYHPLNPQPRSVTRIGRLRGLFLEAT